MWFLGYNLMCDKVIVRWKVKLVGIVDNGGSMLV